MSVDVPAPHGPVILLGDLFLRFGSGRIFRCQTHRFDEVFDIKMVNMSQFSNCLPDGYMKRNWAIGWGRGVVFGTPTFQTHFFHRSGSTTPSTTGSGCKSVSPWPKRRRPKSIWNTSPVVHDSFFFELDIEQHFFHSSYNPAKIRYNEHIV